MKVITARLPEKLDEQLTEYAKQEELSKNQVIKKAIRKLLNEEAKGA